MTPRPIVILGPTAGGKSDLAVALAEALGAADADGRPGQIIGADSMQVYRHMDAGTAKPSAEQRSRVTHHLIDIVEPRDRFTVANWLDHADALIHDLQARGVRPIVVGGTNLYIKALLEGLFGGPPADPDFRKGLESRASVELHRELQTVDPAAAERIHVNDRKKLVRALEVYHATGKRISDWQEQWGAPDQYRHDPHLIGLEWPVDEINRRINARVKGMFFPPPESGIEPLVDEVRRLDSQDLLGASDNQARQALGYKQVLEHLAGRCTLEEALEQTKIQTRRFAKAQRTWLKRFRGVNWLSGSPWDPDRLLADSISTLST